MVEKNTKKEEEENGCDVHFEENGRSSSEIDIFGRVFHEKDDLIKSHFLCKMKLYFMQMNPLLLLLLQLLLHHVYIAS